MPSYKKSSFFYEGHFVMSSSILQTYLILTLFAREGKFSSEDITYLFMQTFYCPYELKNVQGQYNV